MSAEPRKFNFDFSYWSHDGFKEEGNGYMVPDKSHANGTKYADQVSMTCRCLFELKCLFFASKKLSTGEDPHNWTGRDIGIFWLGGLFWPERFFGERCVWQQCMAKSTSLNPWKNTNILQLIIPINLFLNTFSLIFRWYLHSRQILCHFAF